ncbi:tetratricopeptide repeat protein [Lutibacter sp.]
MKEEKYIVFDKYLTNELTQEALTSFEEKLQSDANFKQEFEIYKALNSSLSSKFENEEEEKKLRDTLSNLGKTYLTEEKANKKKGKVISLINYKQLMVAASIALLIGFFIFKDGNPVYNDFSNHTPLELVVRSENNTATMKAEEAFNSKNYKEAFKQLSILANKNPNDTEIQLYKGISLLELNEYAKAEAIFNKISSGNSSFSNTAKWYKALVFLKQGKLEKCKKVLKTIPESAEEYKQAKKLLRKL